MATLIKSQILQVIYDKTSIFHDCNLEISAVSKSLLKQKLNLHLATALKDLRTNVSKDQKVGPYVSWVPVWLLC